MMIGMARNEIPLREWAEKHGWSLGTVRMWLKLYGDELRACRSRLVGRTWLYYEGDLDRWKKTRPTLGHGRPPSRAE
jgi:hypothetical protein